MGLQHWQIQAHYFSQGSAGSCTLLVWGLQEQIYKQASTELQNGSSSHTSEKSWEPGQQEALKFQTEADGSGLGEQQHPKMGDYEEKVNGLP